MTYFGYDSNGDHCSVWRYLVITNNNESKEKRKSFSLKWTTVCWIFQTHLSKFSQDELKMVVSAMYHLEQGHFCHNLY